MSINMFNCDCMDWMKDKPDNYYELAIVDPEYGISVNMNIGVRSGEIRKHKVKKWDSKPPCKNYFIELFRVSKNQIIWGANHFVESLSSSRGWIYWDKMISGDVDFSSGELAFTSFDTCMKTIKLRVQNMVYSDGKSIHHTQKPVELYKWLLQNYAKLGDKILDTHGGSGSICIACNDMGFDLDWMELDKDYYKSAKNRYEKHISQIRMF